MLNLLENHGFIDLLEKFVMDPTNELVRTFACDIVQNAGILLKLPQVAMTTAQMLIQRVYYVPGYSPDKYPLDITAMAALFQAAKIEECRRDAKQVIDVCTHVISRKFRKDFTLSSLNKYERVREDLLTAERRLLQTLGFRSLLSIHPHKIIVNYYHALVHKLDPDEYVWRENDNQRLIQRAWSYCNDSLRTDVFLRYSKEVVACACIEMACEDISMLFPKSTQGQNWYCLFVPEESEVKEAIDLVRGFYKKNKINPNELTKFLLLNQLFTHH